VARAIEDPAAFRHAVREGEDTLGYEQRTWRFTDSGEVPSHWEVGLCWVGDRGRSRLSSAQNGRTEAMLEHALADGLTLRLELATVAYGLDARPTRSARTLLLSPVGISYEMHMATARVPELTLHLRARLTRVAEGDMQG
jgi:hypothetical protein